MAAKPNRTSTAEQPAPSGEAPRDTAPQGGADANANANANADPGARRAERVRKLRNAGIAALAGVIWFLSCADFDIWVFAWFAMVPVMFLTERARSDREAFLYAWICGVVGNIGGFYWIAGLLVRFGEMPWPLALFLLLLMGAYQGMVFGLFGLTTRVVRRHIPAVPMALIAPLAIVTWEHLLPMIFPFYVAITQAWQPHVIQVADLAGPLGVSALLLLVNGGLYDLLARRKEGGLRAAGVAAGVLLAALGYGHYRIAQVDRARAAAPKIHVGVVQPNIAFDLKGTEHVNLAEDQLRGLHEHSQALAAEGADLIVWPETGYPYPILRTQRGDFPEGDDRRVREGFDVPLVFGAVTLPPGRSRHRRADLFNTAMIMDRDGRIAGRFDKIFLMVFGEYVPLSDQFEFIDKVMPSTVGHFAHGERVNTLPYTAPDGRTYPLGPMICYEDILPNLARQVSAQHPYLLVNITNDAWFGETSEPWEHLALSVYRAVEARTDLVRAVNTGVSAWVDAAGRVYHKSYAVDPALHPHPPSHHMAEVALVEGGHTVFAKYGNWFAWLCALATGAMALAYPRWKRLRAAQGGAK